MAVLAVLVVSAGCSSDPPDEQPASTETPTTTTSETLSGAPGEFIAGMCASTSPTLCDQPPGAQQDFVDVTCELVFSAQELAETLGEIDPATSLTVDELLAQNVEDADPAVRPVMETSIELVLELGADAVCV